MASFQPRDQAWELHLELVYLLLFALCFGWAYRWLGKRIARQRQQIRQSESLEEETLSTRLYKINEALEPIARNFAHSNELTENTDFRKAVALLSDPDVPVSTLADYAFGQAWLLSCAAFCALREREDGSILVAKVPAHFDNLFVWQMRFALEFLATARPGLPAGAPLIGFRDWWTESAPLRHTFEDYLALLGDDDPGDVGPEVTALPLATRQQIGTFLGHVRHPLAARLTAQLGLPSPGPEPSFLMSLGRFWEPSEDSALLLEPHAWTEALKAAEQTAERRPARVLLISGDPLVGKTSFLRLLSRRFAAKGWRIFEASGAELQAGQIYIGQLEGRIRQAIEELDVSKKIIWYVPDLLALATSGTHQGQSASILDQILPAMTTGHVFLWSEATPAATARLQQLRPAVRRNLEIVRLDPMRADETLLLAERLSQHFEKALGVTVDPAFARTAVDVAQHYLNSASLPGSALALMKSAAQRADRANPQRVSGRDILETVAQLTGLPLSILDGAERLSLDSIRAFFAGRVIGQPEAVESLIARIAMLKSGLNDPGKPIGVFLFAGPTGTGKTELAKTAAEYLFGSVDRMIRLDMSEYQTPEAAAKILGGAGLSPDADTLVARVRKQPFSLLLLDEFEKAHPQIWDLFLQVFDDGRLTDASGQVADFRHCLIILTTNLGATAHRDSGMGFRPSSTGFADDQVLRSIAQTFRPEFQNRLDRVIVFRPLTRELMRKILKKELARLFERRGLKDRSWAVEWDATALEFLLEKGFSPDMGARPLKRAIDEYVIAPLAETIVERLFPEGDQFVFIRRDGEALRADFIDPHGGGDSAREAPPAQPATGEALSLPDLMRTPSGGNVEIAALAAAQRPIAARIASPDWKELKSELMAEIGMRDFWSRNERFQVLARLELMDRIEVAADTAASLQARLARNRDRSSKPLRELVSRLATQIYLVKEGFKDLDQSAPVEVAVLVTPAFAAGADDDENVQAWSREIAAMYTAWARKRHMRISTIEGLEGFSEPALIVTGFGAHRTLEREAGLHVLERGGAEGETSRITAQVLLAIPPLGNASKTEIRKSLAASFSAARAANNIVRRYRRSPSPLVRSADGTWRSGKVEEVLRGNFDLLSQETS